MSDATVLLSAFLLAVVPVARIIRCLYNALRFYTGEANSCGEPSFPDLPPQRSMESCSLARNPAEASSVSSTPADASGLRDILFVFRGKLDIVSVAPMLRGVLLRARIAQQLKVEDACTLRLVVLKRDDGTWADQDDAETAPGRELRYPQPIAPILPPTGDHDMVHLRVEQMPEHKDVGEDGNKEEAVIDSDGEDVSSAEESKEAFNVALRGSMKKRKASSSFAFSNCDKNTTESIFKFKRVGTYSEAPVELPEHYMRQLKEAYRIKMRSWVMWSDAIEEERRAFINAVLEHCIAPINDQLWDRVKDDEDLYHKQRLELHASVDLKAKGMDGVGKADYVIQRGDRMVVVIEAKRCDITKAKHQNFAVMEASRVINKSKNTSYRTIKGICTDFHSWVFVSREKRSICTDSTSMVLTNGIEVPQNFDNIVNKVYGMLVRL